MEKTYFVAVDLGATSGRVILSTVTGESIEMETIHRFPTPLLNTVSYTHLTLPTSLRV